MAEQQTETGGRAPQSIWVRNVVTLVVAALVVGGAVWLADVWRSAGAGTSSAEAMPSPGDAAALAVGEAAPPFAAVDLEGNSIGLDSLKGRPTWLIFNATWCTDCRVEAPDIQAVHDAHADDLNIVAFYVQDRETTVRDWSATLGLTYAQVVDSESEVARAYGVLGIPHHVFLDREGKIVESWVGTLSASQMAQHIDALFE